MVDTAEEQSCPWLVREGWFQKVVGHREARELLADHRLAADLIGLFEGLGVRSGPFWEITKASLLSMNGEEHQRLRALVAGHFTPRAVERVRPHGAETARSLVDNLATAEPSEFIQAFATPYVSISTGAHVGFPVEDVESCTHALELIGSGTRDLGSRLHECTEGIELLAAYAERVLELRRTQPADDLLTEIVGHVDAGAMPDQVAVTLVASLMSAGHEPTVNQLGLSMITLSEHPDVWDAIGAGRLPVGRAVEELLRYRSTNQGVNRLITEPVDYQGVHLRAGQQLLVGLAEANHDPTHFDRPTDFDPEANAGAHLSFGFGPHYCLGGARPAPAPGGGARPHQRLRLPHRGSRRHPRRRRAPRGHQPRPLPRAPRALTSAGVVGRTAH